MNQGYLFNYLFPDDSPLHQQSRASADQPLTKHINHGCMLPWWTALIGWFLVVALTGVCGFFTILYTFNYGLELSIQWLKSLVISFVSDLFFAQPIKVLGVALFVSLVLRKPDKVQHINPEVLVSAHEEQGMEGFISLYLQTGDLVEINSQKLIKFGLLS